MQIRVKTVFQPKVVEVINGCVAINLADCVHNMVKQSVIGAPVRQSEFQTGQTSKTWLMSWLSTAKVDSRSPHTFCAGKHYRLSRT